MVVVRELHDASHTFHDLGVNFDGISYIGRQKLAQGEVRQVHVSAVMRLNGIVANDFVHISN